MSFIDAAFGQAVYGLYTDAGRNADTARAYFKDIEASGCPSQELLERAREAFRGVCAVPLFAQINAERTVEYVEEGDQEGAVIAAGRVLRATGRVFALASEIADIRARVLGTDQSREDAGNAAAEKHRMTAAIEQFVADANAKR